MLGIALSVVIVVLSALFGRLSHADGVCGDTVRDDGEQCDDGNLSNGDGCSNACSLERCGNGTVDAWEQCDDGNTRSGDGCSGICRIEFCGDTVTQSDIGEQCDDGNGLSGDGCSSLCKSEGNASSSSSSEASSLMSSTESSASEAFSSSSETHQAAPDEIASSAASAQPIAPQAIAAANFFLSPDSIEYKQYVSQGQQDQLLTIMHRIESGMPLSDQEKIWAKELLDTLTAAREAERARYTDLLKQFIATPISSDVVIERNLTEQRLIDVAVPVAVDELRQAISVIERGELQSKVLSDLAFLKRQGLDLESELPLDLASSLAADARSVNVFETLKKIKEVTEKYATTDLDASLQLVRLQAETVRTMLPIFEREYGLQPETVSTLLDDIDTVSRNVTKQDSERVVAAVNRFLSVLERQNVIRMSELSVATEATHPAAQSFLISSDADIEILAKQAPAQLKDVFEKGSLKDQKTSLVAFLEDHKRLQTMISSLAPDQRQEFRLRFDLLKERIGAIGSQAEMADTTCDDSMQEALLCTASFLDDVQTVAREQSLLSNLIGKLQDTFGIGQ